MGCTPVGWTSGLNLGIGVEGFQIRGEVGVIGFEFGGCRGDEPGDIPVTVVA